jgi:predicted ATPase/class 3 adenylate cyclase
MTSDGVVQQINTYVFTDMEDSTRLTRSLPTPVWRRLKERHDELVRACATAAGGQVVKSLGDGFLVVFPNEEPAIRFAVALQRAVRAEPWREVPSMEVRIGMDTGPAVFIPDPPDYDGDALNVASRICARARPGEVLLSARSYFGARPSLDRPGGEVRLEPAGAVRLKGLSTLEPLYRAWAPGLREGFPPLTRAGNLGAYLGASPFIGRAELLEEVAAALRRHPVVTLLGPGGMGKTRLSLEAGARVEAEFPAGVWFVPLEAVRRGEAVTAELLAALGLPAEGADPEQRLLQLLTDWRGLLILDNLEQLVEEDGSAFTALVGKIARRCPEARLLCTSRIDLRLGHSIESCLDLPPLPIPEPRAAAAELRDCPSAQLCAERLRLRARHFSLDDASAPHVATICRATDGVPLLIELAAGQLGRRTLPQIARDVERALIAPGRDADRPDRHLDLTRLLDWSVTLLREEQREFFLRLGVFRGGFDAEAAAFVTDEPRAEAILERLVEAHLVSDPAAEDYLAEHPRYRLLSSTAAYCRARLGEELRRWEQRHAEHYGTLARAAGRDLFGTAPRAAHADLARERENLAAAFETALGASALHLAAGIGASLWELYHRLGLWPLAREGADRLRESAVRAPAVREKGRRTGAPVRPVEESVATMALAQAAHDEGQAADARDLYRHALELWRDLEEEEEGEARAACSLGAARALHGLGNAFRRQNPEAAARAYEESLEIATRLGDEPLRALNLMMLGMAASRRGRPDEGEQRLSEAVALFRSWDDPWGLAIALNARAQNLEALGQPLQARDIYVESLSIKRELGDRRGTAITLAALARLAPAVGEPEAAAARLMESLAVNRELGDVWGCAVTLGALAERWLAGGDAEAALEAAAAARAALETLGGGASEEAGELEALMRAARARIPVDQAEARERRGRETPVMRACEAALGRNG